MVFLLYSGIFLSLILLGLYLRAEPAKEVEKFDAEKIIASMGTGNTSVFEDVRDSLKDIIKKWGIHGAIAINTAALRHSKYGIYQCHVIMHLIGHEAVVYYGTDYGAVINQRIEFCELGYQHGAEAQVVYSGGDYKDELYKMCGLIQKKDPNAACFHGAGHAFMNDSLDVDKSLKLCDDLVNEKYTVENMMPCYNSVFAELTNLVGGKDGGTGIEYTGGPPLSIGNLTALQYCSKFGDRYKVQCLFEFSGLGINENSTSEEVTTKLLACSDKNFEEKFEAACIHSVAAVGTQHELAYSNTVRIPKHIYTLPKALRTAYIYGAGNEILQYMISGVPKDWNAFCNSFSNTEDKKTCTQIFANFKTENHN